MNAYTLVAPLARLMQPRHLPKVPVVEAIRQHIDLLLATRLGEYRFDPLMGSAVWQGDYTAITNPTIWKGETEQAIAQLILRYEKRLITTRVYVDVDDLDETDQDGGPVRARKRLTIRVGGTLFATDEALPELAFILYINPVASE
ncbi:GPW/gp25 family protein [Fibrella sp. HMF5335]|uniref:GPW/gp25 family protein n=1 Tax=Fibrella rubiginis TaxID=2817060 RepID=A0A939GFT0_9BACT|nr:GPW/gp25 family protein [Fibrella rubiginis]MBO0936695.1 GPW/gp25 family protein [Fibrella rubiginis]